MTPETSQFKACWFGLDIPNYRAGEGTYCEYPYDSLPPVPEEYLDPEFDWLKSWIYEQTILPHPRENRGPKDFEEGTHRIRKQAASLNLALPPAFTNFMGNFVCKQSVPSPTGCYWRWPDRIVEHEPGHYLILFSADSQGVLFWYLYLQAGTSNSCVVASSARFGFGHGEAGEELDELYLCARSFEEYVFRTWVENTTWEWINFAKPLEPIQQRYVDHYRPPGDTSDRRLRCSIHDRPFDHGHKLFAPRVMDLLPKNGTVKWENETRPCEFVTYPSGRNRANPFLNANAYREGNLLGKKTTVEIVPTAFCFDCRRLLVKYLEEHNATQVLEMLRSHSEIEGIG